MLHAYFHVFFFLREVWEDGRVWPNACGSQMSGIVPNCLPDSSYSLSSSKRKLKRIHSVVSVEAFFLQIVCAAIFHDRPTREAKTLNLNSMNVLTTMMRGLNKCSTIIRRVKILL